VAAPPMAIPMLAGLVWRRASNAGAVAGFLSGISTGLCLFALISKGMLTLPGKTPEIVLTLCTVVTTLVVLVVVSLFRPSKGQEKWRKDCFIQKLRTPVPPAVLADRTAIPSPWGAVGVSVIATAILLLAIQPAMGWNTGSKTNLIVGVGLLIMGMVMWRAGRRGNSSTPER
jgi:hypothetical protein